MLLLLLATGEEEIATPTYTSSTTFNGVEYCYNYYYSTAEGFPEIMNVGMKVANYSCITTLILSAYQITGLQFNIRLVDRSVDYALVAQVTSARFRDLTINVNPQDANGDLFSEFTFALAVHGEMLTVTDSSIKFDNSGILLASQKPGLVSFLMNYTSLVSYANLSRIFENVDGGFFSQVYCSFNQENGDEKGYLAQYLIACDEGEQMYMTSSCSLGYAFDEETRKCYSEIVSGMDCKECALGYIRGRLTPKGQTEIDETKGCFERAGSADPLEYDCYYTDTNGFSLEKRCLPDKKPNE